MNVFFFFCRLAIADLDRQIADMSVQCSDWLVMISCIELLQHLEDCRIKQDMQKCDKQSTFS